MANAKGQGGKGGAVTDGKYVKHAPGTNWVFFGKQTKVGARTIQGPGWIAVGSKAYHQFMAKNTVSLRAPRGGGTSFQVPIPSKKQMGQWNPQRAYDQSHNINYGQKAPNQTDSGRGGENTTSGKTTPVTAGGGGGGNGPTTPGGSGGGSGPKGPKFQKVPTGQVNVGKVAKAEAGMTYTPAIKSLRAQISNTTGQNSMDLADVSSWFNKVLQANTDAGTADAAAAKVATTSSGNLTARLLAGIGGGANADAGQVADQGSANQALLNFMGASNASLHAGENTDIQNESAQASTNQMNLGNNALAALQQSLTSAIAQRGSAREADAATLRQQNFQNLIASQQANLADIEAGLQIRSGRQQVKAVAGNKGLQTPFAQLSPSDMATLIAQAAGQNSSGVATHTWNQAIRQLVGMGYGGASANPRIVDLLSGYYNKNAGGGWNINPQTGS